MLTPCMSAEIGITFNAIKQEIFDVKFTVECFDVEKLDMKQEVQEVGIKSEAFRIDVEMTKIQDGSQVEFEQNKLDFNNVQVDDIVEEYFIIKNQGLYDINYNFKMTDPVYLENFRVIPSEGILGSQEEQ